MKSSRIRPRRGGLTLVEVLIVTVILAALAAFIYPTVVTQTDKWQALKVAADLRSLGTGLRVFHMNVGTYPLYLSHLGHPITTNDSTTNWEQLDPKYDSAEVAQWNGPYIDLLLAADLRIDDARQTGYDGVIVNDLYCFDPVLNDLLDPGAECAAGHWIAILVTELIGDEFEVVNDMIDGEHEPTALGPTGSRANGRLRFLDDSGIDHSLTPGSMYFLVHPWRERSR